jgi:hypothetical protein
MPKLWAKRGVGRRGVTPLILPRWLRVLPPALVGWSVELAFAAAAEAGEHNQRPDGGSVPATRQRVVLLPHGPRSTPNRRAEGLQA